MSRSREELKEIARKILDYRRNDHSQLMSTLSADELEELTPLIREVSDEQIAKDRAEHEAFMKKEREFDRETDKFLTRVVTEVGRNRRRKDKEPETTLFLLSGLPS